MNKGFLHSPIAYISQIKQLLQDRYKKGFPIIHFYDQDFVDLYDRTWAWAAGFFKNGNSDNGLEAKYFNYPQNDTINQFEACLSTFFPAMVISPPV